MSVFWELVPLFGRLSRKSKGQPATLINPVKNEPPVRCVRFEFSQLQGVSESPPPRFPNTAEPPNGQGALSASATFGAAPTGRRERPKIKVSPNQNRCMGKN